MDESEAVKCLAIHGEDSILDTYRIRRIDPKNIAIQRKSGKQWVSVSYHGNSLNSLISGLSELIMAQYIPDSDNIASTLVALELELIRGTETIKKMIKRDLYV